MVMNIVLLLRKTASHFLPYEYSLLAAVEKNGEGVLAVPHYYTFTVGRLGKLLCGLDSLPL